MIHVKKRDGRSEVYQPEKIYQSIKNAGGSVDDAQLIVQRIDSIAFDGITTHDIAIRVRNLLNTLNPDAARNYEKYHKDLKPETRLDDKG